MEGEMDLCQEAKCEGREVQESVQAVLRILRCFGIRSEDGNFKRDGIIIFLVELASESTVSLPRNSTVLWDKERR